MATFQPSILAGERFGLLTHIAAMGSDSLCAQMKSWLRLWESNQRSALAAILLDKQVRFLPNSPLLNGSESGGGHFPR
jgi:hypothetical protein